MTQVAASEPGATPAVLVDANVLLDVLGQNQVWFPWSAATLADVADRGVPLVINPVVYAEVSVEFPSLDDLQEALPRDRFTFEDLPWDAAFLAGKAFRQYRRRGGERRSPLPDFYIGAHAAVRGYTLLTRDEARYRTYFPAVRLIAP